MTFNIDKVNKEVELKIEPSTSLAPGEKAKFDKSVADTRELIRVLNFEYIPLYKLQQKYFKNQEGKRALAMQNSAERSIRKEVDATDHENLKVGLQALANYHQTLDFNTRGMSNEELTQELRDIYAEGYAQKMKDMVKVGGQMKFANPLVWMMYKYFAYQKGEIGSTPIITIDDLVNHCASKDYICTKRFHFINEWLEKNGFGSLRNKKGDIELSEIFTDPKFIEIALSPELGKEWDEYEKIGKESTEKWKEYTAHLKDFGIKVLEPSELKPNFIGFGNR